MKNNRSHVCDLTYHLVWVTKYRKDVFSSEKKRSDMKNIILSICSEQEIEVLELEVVNDHIHLVCSFPTKFAITYVVRVLKGLSARMWFKLYPETRKMLYKGHLYSSNYFAGTVGNVSKEVVLNYVKAQLTKKGGERFSPNSSRH